MFVLLEGASYSGPAQALPSSELKKLHDERSSHGLPAPTAEEELALQTARRLSARQAHANNRYHLLWAELSRLSYADCQRVHGVGGRFPNKSCGYHSCPHRGGDLLIYR